MLGRPVSVRRWSTRPLQQDKQDDMEKSEREVVMGLSPMVGLAVEKNTKKHVKDGFSRTNMVCLAILCYVNLINMDRYTVSAIRPSVCRAVSTGEEVVQPRRASCKLPLYS